MYAEGHTLVLAPAQRAVTRLDRLKVDSGTLKKDVTTVLSAHRFQTGCEERVRQTDEWKTEFNTPLGHLEYLVMPFGLTNSPAIFQALVDDFLRDMLNKFFFVYLGNIHIFSETKRNTFGLFSGICWRSNCL